MRRLFVVAAVASAVEVSPDGRPPAIHPLAVLSSRWASNGTALALIQRALTSGQAVHVRGALVPEVADSLARALRRMPRAHLGLYETDPAAPPAAAAALEWADGSNESSCAAFDAALARATPGVGATAAAPPFQQRHRNVLDQALHPEEVSAFRAVMRSARVVALVESLTGARRLRHAGNPSEFVRGDFSAPHNDAGNFARRVSYVLHLAEGWDSAVRGGGLWWCGPPAVGVGAAHNALTLFGVSRRSSHFVEPVRDDAPADQPGGGASGGAPRRLAISGFYVSDDDDEIAGWRAFADAREPEPDDPGVVFV